MAKTTPKRKPRKKAARRTLLWGFFFLTVAMLLTYAPFVHALLPGGCMSSMVLIFPVLGSFLAAAICILMGLLLFLPIWQETQLTHCAKCGYPLHSLPEPRCPECGTPFDTESIHDTEATQP